MRTTVLLPALMLAAIAAPASAQYLHLPEPNIVDNSVDGSIHATPMRASELAAATANGSDSGNAALDQQTGGGMIAGQRYATVTGGVTDDDRAALDGSQRDKSLKLVFAATNGEYLGDVNVSIKTAKGEEVSNFKADGPYNFVALPAGSYMVTAMSNGETRTRKVAVGKGQKTYTIRFSPQ